MRFGHVKSKEWKFSQDGTWAVVAGVILSCVALAVGAQSPKGDLQQDSLKPYTTCRFDDGLRIVQVDRAPQDMTSRSVMTANGEKKVSVEDGYRIMTAYPNTDFFTNIKAEKSNPDLYPEDKQAVLENLQWVIDNSAGLESKKPTQSTHQGRVWFGLDRGKIEGGVEGIYILFDDSEHVITTVYFLNQRPEAQKFNTLEDYRKLGDHFLDQYTGCLSRTSKETE